MAILMRVIGISPMKITIFLNSITKVEITKKRHLSIISPSFITNREKSNFKR